MRTFLIWCCLLSTLYGQNSDRQATYPRLYALIELARATPPELNANAFLRLLDAQAIPTADWQLDLAREALALARSARHAAPQRLAPGLAATDSRAMLWQSAHQDGLDRLTLSLRAMEHIRRHNSEAARQAWADLPRPAPNASSCKDPLLDDLSAWYRAAGRLRVPALPILQSIQSHGEIAPAIDLIFESRQSATELDTLVGALANRMSSLPADSRSFTAALPTASPKLKHLLTVLQANQRPTAALADGWRAWLTAGLEAPACEEARSAGPQEQARHDAADLFAETVPPPLPPEIRKPSGESIAADLGRFQNNAETQEQSALFRELLFGKESRALSPAEKDTPEWRASLQKYMQSIEARTRSSAESDLEYFYRTAQLWAGVLMVTPPGPVRQRALQSHIGFLLANAPHIDLLLWYSQVEALAATTRALQPGEFPKVLQTLHQTGHPVLQLFAALETAYPTVPTVREN